jgi:hypothetical protein
MDEHEAAVKATGRKVTALSKAREEHIAAVVSALKAGKRPTEVVSWSPLTAARVRQIAREAKIPPARKGSPPG